MFIKITLFPVGNRKRSEDALETTTFFSKPVATAKTVFGLLYFNSSFKNLRFKTSAKFLSAVLPGRNSFIFSLALFDILSLVSLVKLTIKIACAI